MARVSDQDIVNQLDTFHEDPYLLDLRDARALLAWIEQQCRREYHSPEDLQRTILAELEGQHEQS